MIRLAILVSVIWAMPVLLAATAGSNLLGGYSAAADEKKKKTRKVPALREQTYKKLAEAQMMIDPESMPRKEGEPVPEPKGTPRDAIDLLMKMLERRGLNSYEKAQIWNTLAFAYYTVGDTPGTIRAYENVINQGVITESLENSVLRALFQLYFGEEQYAKSVEYIERWETLKGQLDAGVTFIKATAYYQMAEFHKSLETALLVEEVAIAAGMEIKENWWYLQVVLFNELNDYDNVIVVLEKLILKYPKKQYWMHLAAMYGEKEQEDKALSAYYAIYAQNMLTKESELVMLSQRLLNADVPYEAASVMESGFKAGIIEENLKNLKLLATSYTMAKEMEKAIDSWQDATKFAEDGEIYYRLAQAQANEDHFNDSVKSYRKALEVGDIKNVADVQFWLAISLMNLEKWDDATRAFRAAGKDKKKSKTVRQYIQYISGEKRRQSELRKMLEAE
jgi:tetratricopeptide (TPR) repeat protein